jgi:hypothetical protein
MEYFWKENKRFVAAVGGACLFLLFFYMFALWPIRSGADAAISQRNTKKRDLEKKMAQGVPNPDGLSSGRRDRDLNQKLLASMTPEVAFALGERYVKPKKENIKSYYDNLKLDLVKELHTKATGGKVAFPANLGLPDDVSDETAVEVLSRLAIVDRIVTLAVDSEVEKIDVVDAQYGMERDERGSKKSQFLTKYSVFIKISAKAESIFKVIHGAQKKGSYLSVTHFEMGRPDATKDLFEASIGVALLRVDDKGVLEAK